MPTRSIFELLAEVPSGAPVAPATMGEVTDYLHDQYIDSKHEAWRKAEARQRDRIYRDAADPDVEQYIDEVFQDPEVKRLRKQFVSRAKYNNTLRRNITERSVVYSQPALRTVAGNQETYSRFQQAAFLDHAMRQANELLNLHNDVLLQFRVRDEGFRRVPVIDVVHPGMFSAVAHPLDHTRLIAIIVDHSSAAAHETDPHFRVWTHHESFLLDKVGRFVDGSYELLPFDRMPMMVVHAIPPTIRGSLLDTTSGGDMVAAALNVMFQNVLLLKESKSANKQQVFSGDLSTTAQGQSADSELDLVMGEGVSTTTIDRGMDLSQFRANADHIEERSAGNYGIPPAILRHDGASSGHELELRMLPIKELRRKQIVIFRAAEREFAEIHSMVLRRDMPELAFSTDGWAIDFGELTVPKSPRERLDVFEQERQMGLTDTLEEIRKRNPDLVDDDAARVVLQGHIDNELQRNLMMRPLAAVAGGMRGMPADANMDDEAQADDGVGQ